MTQNVIVAILVLLAAIYSVWYVLPTTLRQRLGRIHHRLGPSKPCATCSGCGGCASGQLPNVGSKDSEKTIQFYPSKKA